MLILLGKKKSRKIFNSKMEKRNLKNLSQNCEKIIKFQNRVSLATVGKFLKLNNTYKITESKNIREFVILKKNSFQLKGTSFKRKQI